MNLFNFRNNNENQNIYKNTFNFETKLVLSFLFFILFGAFLLTLPISTTFESFSFVDSLFTATSATCVTGLAVTDTGTTFTLFGQLVILTMIQVGGLGIMTFSTAFLFFIEGKLSIGSRDIITETFNQGSMPDFKDLLKTIFYSTIVIEGIGSFLLAVRFSFDMPILDACYFGIFHAVSAFCNAGFSLFSDNLISYKGDILVNLVICSLIISGGLGFIVLYEIKKRKHFRFKNYSFHSRVIFAGTAFLITAGTLFIFIAEFNDEFILTQFLRSLFQSVTARTAGFNSVDLTTFSNPSLLILIILMFIGAGPASCAGGIKVSTAAILSKLFASRFNNQENVNIFNRQIPPDTVAKAISITFFSAFCIALCTMFLLLTEIGNVANPESRGMFMDLLFEATSAFGTVGLSLNISPKLTDYGKIAIIILMFIGRLGPLTIAMTLGKKDKINYSYAKEKILIG